MKPRDVDREKREQLRGEPVETIDGRDIDPALGTLSGEGSHIDVSRPEEAWPLHVAPSEPTPRTYYGLPVLKRPVWKGWIPTYFFVGGAAGGAAVLAAASQIAGGPALRPLVTKGRWIAAGGVAIGAGLLIADLGRMSRFLNMMRVFRPTSPMNVGTWILGGAGASSAAAALFGRTRLGDAAGLAAGLFGLPLTAYTAVLIANTAVPIWNEGRRGLPSLFVASAGASAASVLDLLPMSRAERRAVHAFGAVAKVAEIAAARAWEIEVSEHPVVARPLREGTSGALWRAAKVLTIASLALTVAPGRSTGKRVLSGLLGVAAGLATRFAVTRAGEASSQDPHATFAPQRARRRAREEALRAEATRAAAVREAKLPVPDLPIPTPAE